MFLLGYVRSDLTTLILGAKSEPSISSCARNVLFFCTDCTDDIRDAASQLLVERRDSRKSVVDRDLRRVTQSDLIPGCRDGLNTLYC